METNIEVKEKGATVKLTPQSSKQDKTSLISPKKLSSIISPTEVFVAVATDPEQLSNRTQKVIDAYAKEEGFRLDDIKFTATLMPETDTLYSYIEYSALLIFRK